MNLGLRGKRVLVSAASNGLGHACATALAAEGAWVALGGRSRPALIRRVTEIEAAGGRAAAVDLDLEDAEAAGRAVAEVVEMWGGLEALVVNGPGPRSGPAVQMTQDDWSEAFEQVFYPSVRLLQAAAEHMAKHGGGRIVLIGTIGVRTAQRDMVLSNATRLALMGVVKNLSLELARHGVLINQIAPGPIRTDRMRELITQTAQRDRLQPDEAEARWADEVPMGRFGSPEEVGELAAFFCSDRIGFTTGAVIPVDGGKSLAY